MLDLNGTELPEQEAIFDMVFMDPDYEDQILDRVCVHCEEKCWKWEIIGGGWFPSCRQFKKYMKELGLEYV